MSAPSRRTWRSSSACTWPPRPRCWCSSGGTGCASSAASSRRSGTAGSTTPDERLAWLIILATIPVGLAGLLLEHLFRTVLGRPVPAAAFLIANGVILLVGERLRRRARRSPSRAGRRAPPRRRSRDPARREPGRRDHRAGGGSAVGPADRRLPMWRGCWSGLADPGAAARHQPVRGGDGGRPDRGPVPPDAARFSFLLATPVILAAGVLKIPDLVGPLGAGIRGQVLVGSLASVRRRLPVGPVPEPLFAPARCTRSRSTAWGRRCRPGHAGGPGEQGAWSVSPALPRSAPRPARATLVSGRTGRPARRRAACGGGSSWSACWRPRWRSALLGVPLAVAVAVLFRSDEYGPSWSARPTPRPRGSARPRRRSAVADAAGGRGGRHRRRGLRAGRPAAGGHRRPALAPTTRSAGRRPGTSRTAAATGGQLVVAVPVATGDRVVAVARAASPTSRLYLQTALTWLGMAGLAGRRAGRRHAAGPPAGQPAGRPAGAAGATAQTLGEGDFTVAGPTGRDRRDRRGRRGAEPHRRAARRAGRPGAGILRRRLAPAADPADRAATAAGGRAGRPEADLRTAVADALTSTDRLEPTIDELLALARDAPPPGPPPTCRRLLRERARLAGPGLAAPAGRCG